MRPLIFVADDDPVVRMLVELRLERDGYATQTAGDGRTAITALRCCSPVLIILDLQMPQLDGLGVLDWLQRDRRLQRTPAMMLTSSADADIVKEAGRRGARGYLLKPIEAEVLSRRVRQLVRPTPAPIAAPSTASPPLIAPDAVGDVLEL